MTFGLATPASGSFSTTSSYWPGTGMPLHLENFGGVREWNPNLRRLLFDHELPVFQSFLASLQAIHLPTNSVDTIIWMPNPSGHFLVSSFYAWLILSTTTLPSTLPLAH
ncbi:hypothetical protein AMTRI_Chr06g190930 [Amborella trichopoda]